METGDWIAIFLLLSLSVFGVWDFWAWRSGRSTMSSRVVELGEESFLWRLLAMIFAIGVVMVLMLFVILLRPKD